MGQKVTIGGNRVGSGKKMQAELHNYYRSTHNLSEKFRSSIAPGILYPCYTKVGMRGDTFDIDIAAGLRTIPTKAPLFGSYKMQVDVYQCPVRLYQGILHNNPQAIGLKMSQVLFPKIKVEGDPTNNNGSVNTSSLLSYLGLKGIGHKKTSEQTALFREVNALKVIAYYDIFKTYYANKQEERGYVITSGVGGVLENTVIDVIVANGQQYSDNDNINITDLMNSYDKRIIFYGKYLSTENIIETESNLSLWDLIYTYPQFILEYNDSNIIQVRVNNSVKPNFQFFTFTATNGASYYLHTNKLVEFPLQNIDEMRYNLLSAHTLGTAYHITSSNELPYGIVSKKLGGDKYITSQTPLNGLVVKTYQNDIFNNWLNTEWIEGDNGIKGITDIDVSGGTLSIDTLNLQEKLYNMLNRVALAGNTYEDWQDVVYEEVKRRQIESPIFCGGMSREVVFDEIVQSAPTQDSALGTLGGRGRLSEDQNGGHITIKCDEACIIMAIVSLTPRICYTQGNDFDLTEIESMDDLHKPALDGIGYQDLIGERMAWWDTAIDQMGHVSSRTKIGKLPAWIEYMTSVDKAYGDFAELDKAGFMVLSRNYERGENNEIVDPTTYIDPAKFNYAFAYDDLTSQNFWVQINFKVKSRRLMSARLIPNV